MNPTPEAETQLSPEDVQNRYGIKKDAYYDRLKFLGIKAAKDSTGKAFISSNQIELLDELNEHIKEHGKMDGFTNKNSMSESGSTDPAPLATTTTTTEQITTNTASPNPDPFKENLGPMDELINLAAGIAAQRIAAPHLVALEIANSMQYEDLPTEYQQRVDEARNSVQRPAAAVGKLAIDLLNQWREKKSPVAA